MSKDFLIKAFIFKNVSRDLIFYRAFNLFLS